MMRPHLPLNIDFYQYIRLIRQKTLPHLAIQDIFQNILDDLGITGMDKTYLIGLR